MFSKIKIALLVALLFGIPLAISAAEEADFVDIFEKFNEARKTADIKTLTTVLVDAQVKGIEECIDNSICGEHFVKNLKNDALISYRVTDFVEFDSSGNIVKHRNRKNTIEYVSGPAAQIYYVGEEVRGDKGQGIMTFVMEEGEWKISMTLWKKKE